RPDIAEQDDAGGDHLKVDCAGEPDCLLQTRCGQALGFGVRGAAPLRPSPAVGANDDGTAGARAGWAQAIGILVASARLQSGFVSGGRLFGALEQLDRMTRHDRRDGVLVDQLRVAIPPQQDAEIIEPRHHALKFHAIDQKNREWRFAFSNVIEKSVLKVLCSVGCHCRCSVIYIYRLRTPAAVLLYSSPTAAYGPSGLGLGY